MQTALHSAIQVLLSMLLLTRETTGVALITLQDGSDRFVREGETFSMTVMKTGVAASRVSVVVEVGVEIPS